jgi:hypothetical protein
MRPPLEIDVLEGDFSALMEFKEAVAPRPLKQSGGEPSKRRIKWSKVP